MKRLSYLLVMSLVLGGLIVGCTQRQDRSSNDPGSTEAQIDGAKFILPAEPKDAKGIIELRKEAKDGDEVVAVGKVGGSHQPLVKGRAAFTVVDLSLKSCDDDPNCYDFA
jgi:hypothetical protein